MLPTGQKRQNETVDHDDSEDDDSENKPLKRNGRRKIKIEYIEDKNRRHITFSKRKAGIMKKAYELSTLTGTQVLLLVVSETGLVYTFTTTKLQPIVTKPEGKNLIQACLNTPDPQPPQQIESQEQSQPELSGSDNQLEDEHNTTNDMNNSNTADASNSTADNNAMANPTLTTNVQQPPTAANPNSYVNRIAEDTSNQLSPQTAASQSPMMPSPNSMSRLPQHPAHASQQPPSFHHQPMNYSQSAAAAAAAAAGMPGRYGQSPYGYHQGLPPPPQQQQQPQQPQQHQQIPQPNNFSYNLQKTYYQPSHQQAQQQQQQQTGYTNTGSGQPQQQPGTPTPAGYWPFTNAPTTAADQNGQQQQTATAQLKSIIKQEHA